MDQRTNSCCPPLRKTSQMESNSFKQAKIRTESKSKTKHDHMIYLSGGEFWMGTDSHEGFYADGEGPTRKVTVHPFYIDTYAVTNAQFSEFVSQTNYVTEAEKFGWSYVFHLLVSEETFKKVHKVPHGVPWWYVVEGADWSHPEGPDSCICDRMDHPVVHISWNDAMAYCDWAGKRLPTEAEWEYAARGGLEQKIYPWGDELTDQGEYQCNIWQGDFPHVNTKKDGYLGTAPVNTFSPNGFGLYNTVGNVWEWCADWFSPHFHIKGPKINPQGPPSGTAKVIKGGSYLCHKSYCNRYRVAARSSNTPDSSTGHMGFRCVVAP